MTSAGVPIARRAGSAPRSVITMAIRPVQKQYGTVPEYLWSKSPDSVVLRHKNGKWYAVFMTVEKSKLGLEGNDLVAIMDVKCDPGATQALTGVRESCFVCLKIEFVHYYRFSSVFGLWHKANSACF